MMTFLKFVGGAIATVILIKIALWVLAVVFGIVGLAIGLLKLAAVVAVIMLICYGVYRWLTPPQKSEA